MDNYFIITRGDWSDDGHGKEESRLVRASLPAADVEIAYARGSELLGHDIMSSCCAEYEDGSLPGEVVDALRDHGYDALAEVDDHDRADYQTSHRLNAYDIWWSIYLHVCTLGNPELQIELVEAEPVHIGGYGFYT